MTENILKELLISLKNVIMRYYLLLSFYIVSYKRLIELCHDFSFWACNKK